VDSCQATHNTPSFSQIDNSSDTDPYKSENSIVCHNLFFKRGHVVFWKALCGEFTSYDKSWPDIWDDQHAAFVMETNAG
jgi:hypothetical protein